MTVGTSAGSSAAVTLILRGVQRLAAVVSPVLSFVLWLYLYLALLLSLWVGLGLVFGGWSPLVVTSGSMEPTLSVGDVLLIEEDLESTLAQRSVVVFEDADGTTVVHRVFAVDQESLVTKGDANPTPDSGRVRPDDVIGVGRLVVPLVGLPAIWLSQGQTGAFIAWVLVSLAAVFQLMSTIQRRRGLGVVSTLAGSMPVAQLGVRRVRLLVAVLILVQHILDPSRFDVLGNEGGRLWLLVGALGTLLGTNLLSSMHSEDEQRRVIALLELAIDTVLVVALATLTGSSGIGWVLFALPIIEAAVRFRLVGALSHWILLTGVTLATRIWVAELRSSSLLLDELETLLDQLSVLFLVVVPGAYLVEQLIGDVQAQQTATGDALQRTALLHSVAEAGHRVARLGGEHLDAIVRGTRALGFDRVDVVVSTPEGWRFLDGDEGGLPPPGDPGSGLRPIDFVHEAVVIDRNDPDESEVDALQRVDLSAVVAQTVNERRGRVVLRAGIAAGRDLRPDQADAFQLLARQASVALQNDELLNALTSMHDELQHQARHDSLTGLPNRALLLHRLTQIRDQDGFDAEASRVALLFLDLNGFKPVNDRLGHEAGDDLLRLVAQRLQALAPAKALVSRLGGDEFTLLLEEASDDETNTLATRIARVLREPFSVGGEIVNIAASIGIAFLERGVSEAELVRRADVAMYHAKRRSDIDHARFELAFDEEELRRARLSADLRAALANEGLHLVYQPIYRLGSEIRIVGSEALVRWEHPELGVVPPSELIEIARASDLLVELNHWIVATACRDTADLLRQNPRMPYFVTVNASPEELASTELVTHVTESLQVSGLSTARFVIEISERLVAIDDPVVNRSMRNLRQAGIGLLLDDFGEGHTSLTYLNELPVTGIKLDRKLVVNTLRSDTDRIILESIVDLCRRLDLEVVAEGVENTPQLEAVLAAGTALVQGYLLQRPVPFRELADVVALAATPPRTAPVPVSGGGG